MDRLFVIALGNPGSRYAFTRHNVGWLIADYIAYREGLKFTPGKGDFWVAMAPSSRFLIFKPTTYMNNSGIAVVQIVNQYKLDNLNEMVVIVDDVNLQLGRMRMRLKGSDGGHNGIKSIIYYLGTQHFPRLRIGIGAPPEGTNLRDYVLPELSQEDFDTLRRAFPVAYEGFRLYLDGKIDRAVQLINSFRPLSIEQETSEEQG